MRFRKKAIEIDAVQWVGDNIRELSAFVGEDLFVSYCGMEITEVSIITLEGDMKVSSQDWVIKGIQGEFYPCKRDVFEQTYERVEDE